MPTAERSGTQMVYYTIHMKGLQNSTGYIDVCLEDEQLLKDYLQFLDLGMRTCKSYKVISPAGSSDGTGRFAVNLSEIAAIGVQIPPAAKR